MMVVVMMTATMMIRRLHWNKHDKSVLTITHFGIIGANNVTLPIVRAVLGACYVRLCGGICVFC